MVKINDGDLEFPKVEVPEELKGKRKKCPVRDKSYFDFPLADKDGQWVKPEDLTFPDFTE